MTWLWMLFGHAWWGVPVLLALAVGLLVAFGVWPVVLAAIRQAPEGWRAAVIALLVALVAASGLYAVGRSHGAQEVQTALDAALEANQTNQAAIERLTAANKAFEDEAATTAREAEKAIADIAAERDRLKAELDRRRKDRQRIYDNDQDAAEWARRPVPAAIADRLRE